MVHISPGTDIREIGSVASGQASKNFRKTALKKPKFSQQGNITENRKTTTMNYDEKKIKSPANIHLKELVKAFKQSKLEIMSFLARVPPEFSNTIRRYLTEETSKD